MDFTLQLNRDDHWTMPKSHFHDHMEILLSLSDGGSFFLMNHLQPLRKGTLLLMQDHALHRSTSISCPYERYVLYIPLSTLKVASSRETDFISLLNRNCCLQLDDDAFLQIHSLMERCMSPLQNLGDDILRDCAFQTLLVSISRLLTRPEIQAVPPSGFSPPIQRTIDWIDLHLSEELTLDILAEHSYITKYHLCRIFKEETSFTIGEYITRMRLLRAAALLRTGESVQKSGELSGFQSNHNFIRTFSRIMGLSPGRYQRLHRS